MMSVPTCVMPPHTLDLMKSWVGIHCGERRVTCVMMNVIVQGRSDLCLSNVPGASRG